MTWRNADPVPHNVAGANMAWRSFDALRRGRSVTYRFVRPGVYPYVCTYHAGMVGAVVVGGGNGPGAANTTATRSGPVVQVDSASAEPDRAAGSESRGSEVEIAAAVAAGGADPAAWRWVALAALAISSLTALGLVLQRRRPASPKT